jgi:hypothetical protein
MASGLHCHPRCSGLRLHSRLRLRNCGPSLHRRRRIVIGGRSPINVRAAKAYPHVFLARLNLGAGHPRSSDHAELLEQDGYKLGSRWNFEAAAAGVIAKRIAIGGYLARGGAATKPSSDAPQLSESILRTGGEVALVWQPYGSVLVLVGPELGMLRGKLSVHDQGQTQTVLEYGGMMGLYFRVIRVPPIFYLGATASYLVAPADPPSGVGRDYDYGAFYLGFTGVVGG